MIDEVAAAWLQAFWDSEGTCFFGHKAAPGGYQRQIHASVTDVELIDEAGRMLDRLGISYSLMWRAGGQYKDSYRISISGKGDISRFFARVGSCIPRKLDALERMVASYDHPHFWVPGTRGGARPGSGMAPRDRQGRWSKS